MKIPFHIPFLTGKEEEYISASIKASNPNGSVSYIEDCESKLVEITKSPFVLLTGSCTHAMEMSLLLLGIQAGDEIICPSFTYVSVVNVILARGATPVFIDCHDHNCNIDDSLIERAITPQTKALIIMHYAGVACNMSRISSIVKTYGISLIEDAAHCIHAYHQNHHLGTYGDFGALSFHKTKNIHCIQGGALLIKNPKHYERAIVLRDMGTNKKAFVDGKVNAYTWVDIGNSFGINPLSAAFLYSQLDKSYDVRNERLILWNYYNEQLDKINNEWRKDIGEHNAHIYYVLCADEDERNQLILYLKEQGIDARFHYMPLHSSAMGHQYRYIHDDDHSSQISQRIVRLPLYTGLTHAEIDQVVNEISKFYHET